MNRDELIAEVREGYIGLPAGASDGITSILLPAAWFALVRDEVRRGMDPFGLGLPVIVIGPGLPQDRVLYSRVLRPSGAPVLTMPKEELRAGLLRMRENPELCEHADRLLRALDEEGR